ncbi:hypothetical protein VagYM19_41840 [Vibrio alginolyticus]|nr:hypothetical protein Vag1382_41810 [Vibrio alginolyticus]BCB49655.1 hypothetical protein VagVIO5_41810 [Vibrio alginolyticus]BCB54257.1 hypothetical protein VagYM19_41840 [Vibrio alginolyticus]BCB58860.1 hypothetical protein VagYM4_41830 [Vibrio alginolyticus]
MGEFRMYNGTHQVGAPPLCRYHGQRKSSINEIFLRMINRVLL